MKILHVCPLYYPAVGGVENVFRAVSEGMVRRGEDVTVFTSTGRSLKAFMDPTVNPLPAGEENIHGVKVRRFPYRRVSRLAARAFTRGWSTLRLPKREALKAWSALPWVPDLASEIEKYRPDIVLAGHFITHVIFDVYKAQKAVGFPLIYHTALHLDTGVKIPRIAIELLKMADAVWANTSYEKDFLVNRGVDGGKVFELGVGVNPEEFRNGNGKMIRERYGIGSDPVILFVGRKEREKGVETLMEAMERVWRKVPEAKLMLAGSPGRYLDERRLKNWMRRYEKSIISIDFFKDEEKKDLYDACDIFVLLSRIESFGIVYLEAWISGKPVIGAGIGSTRSIINNGVDGYLINFGDVEALAEKILYLLKHPHICKEMGIRGREKVLKKYTWDHIIDNLLNIYKSLYETA